MLRRGRGQQHEDTSGVSVGDVLPLSLGYGADDASRLCRDDAA